MHWSRDNITYYLSMILVAGFFAGAGLVSAQSEIDELSKDIDTASEGIQNIEAQIEADRKKLEELEGQKNTLSRTIDTLTVSERSIENNIDKTQNQIQKTDTQIKTLSEQIENLGEEIEENREFISTTIQELHREREKTFWEVILLYNTFSSFLDRLAYFESTGKVLSDQSDQLRRNRASLQGKTVEQAEKKEELEGLTEELSDRKKVVELTKQQKQQVLEETKNTEQTYQQQLAEKLELKKQFEQSLLELESRLQIIIDRTLFANKSQGLFSWPVSNFRITQFFGNTSFANSGAYNGRGHSGTDFAVPIGTPVRAVMDGEVWSAFDTDSVGNRGADGVYRSCVSYGKYVLIKHDNGLSTLVAHNSLIKVKNGDRVKRGDIIAYSGNSGYSTGPHLHFSTYATQGVQVKRLGDVSSTTFYCKDAIIPVISLNAYLDPYDYLPRPAFNIGTAKHGDRGTTVRNIQMMLKHERIFPIEVSANGNYGDVTARSVAQWQKKYGLGDTDGKEFDRRSVERYELLIE